MMGRERELLLDAFDSNWIAPLGPHVDAFEQEFAAKIGGVHAVALSSGTAALHLGLKMLGVGLGDEVLTSSFTFAATANAITYEGAKPVFIDSDWRSWNMDPNLLAEELKACQQNGKLPKAVIVVDVLGQCADYTAIESICNEFEVPVIADSAEALGARFNDRPAGTFGAMSCFSFNGNKIITTSGGGMLVSSNQEYVDLARHLATQAREPAAHYEHTKVGYNYRMSNLVAAVGRGQLENLDAIVKKRRANFEFYQHALADCPGIQFMPEIENGFSTRWLTCMLVDPGKFGKTNEEIRVRLAGEDIESRPVWKPMHQQPAFQDCRMRGGAVCDKIFQDGICLPSGTGLTESDLLRIIDLIRD